MGFLRYYAFIAVILVVYLHGYRDGKGLKDWTSLLTILACGAAWPLVAAWGFYLQHFKRRRGER